MLLCTQHAPSLFKGSCGRCMCCSVVDIPPSMSSSFPLHLYYTHTHTHVHTGPSSEAGHIPAQLWWPAELCVVLCLGLGPSHSTHPTGHPLALGGPFHVQEAGVKGKRRRRRKRGMLAESLSLSLTQLATSVLKGHNRGKKERN